MIKERWFQMKKTDLEMAKLIAEEVKKIGGRTFFVGGCVRDQLLGRDNKDLDIEIHGVQPAILEEILDQLGGRISIGESFGIYNLKGYSLDIAMPRKEKVRGNGHKDFDVLVDPFVGTKSAAMRRDFTINALMQDVLTGEIVDHFNGQEDLKQGIIRHINDETFTEDALRVLRAAQFASRFEFKVASETIKLCRTMDLSHLAKERIVEELKKALLKSQKPSIFFETLREMHQLDYWFKEVKDLIGVKQNPKHHSEGDVWVHTMMTLNEAVKYRDKVANPFAFMLSAITHDFGKIVCTEIINGEIHSYMHEIKGLPIVETFMKRLTNESNLIKYVLNQTEYHMKPNILAADNSSIKATNKMFDQVIDPMGIIAIAMSDSRGKTAPREYISYDDFLYARLAIFNEYMSRPYVTGQDLIKAGLKPGIHFSKILAYAHKLRLAGVEKDNALKQTLAFAKKY